MDLPDNTLPAVSTLRCPLTRSDSGTPCILLLEAALQPRPYTWMPLISNYVDLIPRVITFDAAWHFLCVELRKLLSSSIPIAQCGGCCWL